MDENKDKASLFIDGNFMLYAQREISWHIDFKKVYDYFSKKYKVVNAYFFATIPMSSDIEQYERYKDFRKFLAYSGFTVVDKEAKVIMEKDGSEILKGNLDVLITFHIITSMNTYNEAIIFSGDGDLAYVVDFLRACGKIVTVVSPKGMIALDLINSTNFYIDIEELKENIQKS